ncbi:MAG: DUF1934 domain-containing protein [Blautia sp.]|nr:DUF1934 domain-containing protein [Blautia sp.]
MDRDVIIHIKGLQSIDESGQEEPIEIVVPGQYFLKNGIHYFRYEECFEDFEQPAANYVKILPDGTMEVRKTGLIHTNLVFEKGKKNLTSYTTPYGTLQMGITTTGLALDVREHLVEMKADYSLDVAGEHMANCYIQIRAESKNSPDFVL